MTVERQYKLVAPRKKLKGKIMGGIKKRGRKKGCKACFTHMVLTRVGRTAV